jgi:hypothetical protein
MSDLEERREEESREPDRPSVLRETTRAVAAACVI